MSEDTLILGAGMTGLAAGLVSGLPVVEAAAGPGGICSSYYRNPGTGSPEAEAESYRFEIGGGH
jgi:protoporphyrinogen oxidase